MLIHVSKKDVIEGFSRAAAVTGGGKPAATYTSMIWIEAKAGASSVTAMATDASVEFSGQYSADIEEPGLVGVNARKFVELLKGFPDGGRLTLSTVTTGTDGEKLRVQYGRQRYHLPVGDATWFVPMQTSGTAPGAVIPADLLIQAIDRVEFCVSDELGSDALGCWYMHRRPDGSVAACGLNGHQFAMYEPDCPELEEVLKVRGILLQKRFAAFVNKWMRGDKVAVCLSDRRLFLTLPERAEVISLPLMDYPYPDYSAFLQRLESGDPSRLMLKRADLAASLRRLVPFSTKNDRACRFCLKKDELIMSMSTDVGSGEETIDAAYDGNIGDVYFPASNLLGILDRFVSPELMMTLTTEEGPCSITGDEDAGVLALIMPMKLASDVLYEEDKS